MALVDALRKPIIERVNSRAKSPSVGLHGVTLNRLISPRMIDERTEAIAVGDTWYVFLEAHDFPPAMTLAWMASITEFDRARVFCWWGAWPVPDDEAQQALGASESAARDTIAADFGGSSAHDVRASQGLESILNLRRAIASGADRLVRLSLMVVVAGRTLDEATDTARRIRVAAAAMSLNLAPIAFDQVHAYRTLLHGWIDQRGSLPSLTIDASASVAATLIPAHRAAPRQSERTIPILWGFHPRTNEPVIWDRTKAVNPHALIVASSGSGKTYAMRGLIAQEWAITDDHHHVFIVDPKFQEYRNLVTALNGAYLSMDAQGTIALNPLDLPRMTSERTIHAQHESLVTQQATIVRTLMVQELHAHHYRVTPSDIMLIERAIIESYADYGITDDSESIARASAMPTMSDVQRRLYPLAPALAEQMALFTEGTIGRLINRPSNVTSEHRLIGFDLSALLASDDPMLARILPSAVMIWMMTRALTSARHAHVILDEAHAILRHDAGMRVVERMFRVGRSLGIQVTVITQSMMDVTQGFAAILNENAATKLILGVGANAAPHVARALNLVKSAQEYIAWCHLAPGVGSYALLVAEGQATPVLIRPWPDMIHRLACGMRV